MRTPALLLAVAVAATIQSAATIGTAAAAEPDPAVLGYKMPEDIKWNESPAYPGLKNAVLYGDPSKPGPYLVRNRFEPGAYSRPHFHPNDRVIVVLSGTWWVASGEDFAPESTVPAPAGSFVRRVAGTPHYDGVRRGENLGPMVQRIHGLVAKLVNDLLPKRHLPFWRRAGNQD